MKLSVVDVKKKRELDKPLKLSDGQGLFLLIQPKREKILAIFLSF